MESNKPSLIFIHGFRGNSLGLEELAEQFPDFEVFLPTLPPAEKQSLMKYDTSHYADWIASYITKNKLTNPILIGHSMGSIIATATAEKYPTLVNNKLVLLAPISAKPNKLFALISPLSALLPCKMVDFITTKYLTTVKDRQKFKHILEITNKCSSVYYSKGDVFKTALFSMKHCIEDFHPQKDIILIAGDKDRLMPRKKTEELSTRLPAKAIFLDGTGHLLNYEQPAAVAEAIKQFILS